MPETRNKRLAASIKKIQPFCSRCGISDDLCAHHVACLGDGGEDVRRNLDVLCGACHSEWHKWKEGVVPYSEFLESAPLRVFRSIQESDYADEKTVGEIKYASFLVKVQLIAKTMNWPLKIGKL